MTLDYNYLATELIKRCEQCNYSDNSLISQNIIQAILTNNSTFNKILDQYLQSLQDVAYIGLSASYKNLYTVYTDYGNITGYFISCDDTHVILLDPDGFTRLCDPIKYDDEKSSISKQELNSNRLFHKKYEDNIIIKIEPAIK
jgi:hypothetical protein